MDEKDDVCEVCKTLDCGKCGPLHDAIEADIKKNVVADVASMVNVIKFPARACGKIIVWSTQSLTKREVLSELLKNGVVHIVLDARLDAVAVPAQHKLCPGLVLKLSWKFKPGDLLLDGPDAVRVTLSFDGVGYPCVLPWESIYFIGDIVWLNDIPPDVDLGRRPVEEPVKGESS